MDPDREPQGRPTRDLAVPCERRPADAEMLTACDPDAEIVTAYAAWRGDRTESVR